MAKLGFWQLNRAEFKQQNQVIINDRLSQDVKEVPSTKMSVKDWQYFHVTAKGVYLDELTILVDNVVHKSVAGVSVITPFRPENTEALLLIDRGWIAWGEDRAILPSVDSHPGIVQVSGLLTSIPRENFYLENPQASREPEHLWSQLDFDRFNVLVNNPLQPLMLRLDKDQPGSYKHITQLHDDGWITRHKAYAMQWFALSFTLLVITVVLMYKHWIKKETT